MEIDRKYALNKKKLTKKEVQEILKSNPPLDVELSKPFSWTWASGYVQQNKLYKLPDNKYLFVFDPKDHSTPNRGDLFSSDVILKWVDKLKRQEKDHVLGLITSYQYWKYFSKIGSELISKSVELKQEFADKLSIPIEKLNYTYESLDLISIQLQKLEIEFIRENFIDNLVNYIGEVIIRRVKGHWSLSDKSMFLSGVPYVDIDMKNIAYNPTNVIFVCLGKIDTINLRLETANEVRSQSSRLSFEKHMLKFNK